MTVRIFNGDCRTVLATLPEKSVHCCVTSPPYFGLRDYGVAGQIGLEPTPAAFVAELVAVFAEVRRVLRDDGTLWLNLGDSYAGRGRTGGMDSLQREQSAVGARGWVPPAPGFKDKDLYGTPWRVAFALQDAGWYLRQDIIWHKPNPMPESVTDRCTKSHEYIFLLAKSERYYFDQEAIKEDGSLQVSGNSQHKYVDGDPMNRTKAGFLEMRGKVYERVNRRSVWSVTTKPYKGAHFATFPPDLIEPCILAGCPKGGTVLDPFGGAGTTGLVADRLQRDAVLIELNPVYAALAQDRIRDESPLFAEVSA